MAIASGKKSFALLIIPVAIIALGYLIAVQGIENSGQTFAGIFFFIVCLLNYKLSVALFFFLGFFRNFINFNLFGLFALNPVNTISLILLYHFFSLGLLSKRSLFESKFMKLLFAAFMMNLIVCFRFWIEFDIEFVTGSNTMISKITNYLIFPIQVIYFLNQIFKNIKDEKELKFLTHIIISLSIFAAIYMLTVYLNLGLVSAGRDLNAIWNNPLLGHKSIYGPFYVLLFIMIFQLYQIEKSNKILYLVASLASLFVIAISLSRNAYFSLVLTSVFFYGKLGKSKNIVLGLLLSSVILVILPQDIIFDRVSTSVTTAANLDIEGFQQDSAGHFSDAAFVQIGGWLSKGPFFGGFLLDSNKTESGWMELLKNQGLVGLFFQVSLLFYFFRFFSLRMKSKIEEIKNYAIIGYGILIGVFIINTSTHIIYTYSNSPFVFLLTFIYLTTRWHEEKNKQQSKLKNANKQNDEISLANV